MYVKDVYVCLRDTYIYIKRGFRSMSLYVQRCVAMCCSVMQRVAVCCIVYMYVNECHGVCLCVCVCECVCV